MSGSPAGANGMQLKLTRRSGSATMDEKNKLWPLAVQY
jgi:hypothetical protein